MILLIVEKYIKIMLQFIIKKENSTAVGTLEDS